MATKTLEKLSKSELYERAQAADVPGRSQMDKDELIEALSDGGRRAEEAILRRRSGRSGTAP